MSFFVAENSVRDWLEHIHTGVIGSFLTNLFFIPTLFSVWLFVG
jgi:hypothetical protein